MRLICTISSTAFENPYAFSYYLAGQGIENECEEVVEGGEKVYRIWIYDEDRVEKALELYRTYHENPQDPQFKASATLLRPNLPPTVSEFDEDKRQEPVKKRGLSSTPYGFITILILFSVIALFIAAQIQRGNMVLPRLKGIVQAPLLSPLERTLLYDYPNYFSMRDHLFTLYTPQEISEQKQPSQEAVNLIRKLWKTPVWMGIYEKTMLFFQNKGTPPTFNAPLFEKISRGEVWRTFTPALLHYDLLHLFFNVVWFILLGNQIEHRLGWGRYLFLIIATAIISNTAQYLMSGSFFMGLSGVVVGMAAFILARQQRAPWEGYLLNRLTMIFLGIFVLGMFLLQVVLFFLQIFGKLEFAVSVANTAHLTGALVGYLIGCSRLFAIKSSFTKG